MNGKYYIGDKAVTVKSTGRTRSIDGVALVVDDGTEYRAGDQTGYVLELECPYGTQAMADALLEKLRGRTYEGFETTGAALPMGAELGDGVTVKGLYGPIVRRRVQFVGDLAADVSAPTGGDTDHEFGYTDPTKREIQRAAARSRSYIEKKADEIRIGVESDVDGKLSEFTVDLEGIKSTVRSHGTSISTLQQTANSLSVEINGAEGTAGLKATVSGLEFDVRDPSGAVSAGLSAKVGRDENNQVVSMLNASANEINITGNRFVLDSDNFKVAADGTVTAKNGQFEGTVNADAFTLQGASLEVKEDYVTTYGGDDRGPGYGGAIAPDTLLVITSDIGVKTDRLFAVNGNIAHIGCNDGSFSSLTATYLKAYQISENGTALADKYLLKSDADKYMAKSGGVFTGDVSISKSDDPWLRFLTDAGTAIGMHAFSGILQIYGGGNPICDFYASDHSVHVYGPIYRNGAQVANLQSGVEVLGGGETVTVTFPTAFGTTPVVTASADGAAVRVSNVTKTGFDAAVQGGEGVLNRVGWIAAEV